MVSWSSFASWKALAMSAALAPQLCTGVRGNRWMQQLIVLKQVT
jgi:hypothetical protein